MFCLFNVLPSLATSPRILASKPTLPTKNNENKNGTHGSHKFDTSISVSISSANAVPTEMKNPAHDGLIAFDGAFFFFEILLLMLMLALLLERNNDADDFQHVDRQ